MFRSTGSYEPDLYWIIATNFDFGFDPQALTSLTCANPVITSGQQEFRSTGSYEPDQLNGLLRQISM